MAKLAADVEAWNASEVSGNHFAGNSLEAGQTDELQTFEISRTDELHSLFKDLDEKLSGWFESVDSRLDHLSRTVANKIAPVKDALIGVGCGKSFYDRVEEVASGEGLLGPTEGLPRPVGWQWSGGGRAGSAESSSPHPTLHSEADSRTTVPAFSLRAEWKIQPKKVRHEHNHDTGIFQVEEFFKTLDDLEAVHCQASTTDEDGWLTKPWFILWPSSQFRLTWDLVTMLLVAHDMAVIPVHMGFSLQDNSFSASLFWPFLLFWTVDIPMTFFTGYFVRGKVETKLRPIAINYLTSWFILDVAMVSSSWAEVFVEMEADGLSMGRVGKTLRILQIVRSMRLLRLVKLRRIIEDIQDRITSEYFHIIVAVCRLSVIIVWTNHFIACLWWGIGDSEASTETWTYYAQLREEALVYQYFTALHWSLTQFTPASMEVAPRNVRERIFAVFVLLFAMIVFSSFVSSITAAMTQLRNLTATVDRQFVMLRRYLRVKNIPSDLTVRIVRCVAGGIKVRKEELLESDVDLLKYLSNPLYMELLSHVHAPILSTHPFFERYGRQDPIAMQRVCHRAVKRLVLAKGDMLFSAACTGEQMFFVLRGKFVYFPRRPVLPESESTERRPSTFRAERNGDTGNLTMNFDSGKGSEEERSTLYTVYGLRKDFNISEGEWFCETALWCPWAHMGTMVAKNFCEILALDGPELARVTAARRLVVRPSQRYAVSLVERLNAESMEGANISDYCPVDQDIIEDLVATAFAPTRTHSPAKNRSSDKNSWKEKHSSPPASPEKVHSFPAEKELTAAPARKKLAI